MSTEDTNTLILSPKKPLVDVESRLADLQKWRQQWEKEDALLEKQVHNLGDSDSDIQKGEQIQYLRNILLYHQIVTPLEITLGPDESKMLFSELRQQFANQFVSINKEQKNIWMNNFLFIMTPSIRKLDETIDDLLNFISFGQGRNLRIGGHSGSGKTTFMRWRTSKFLPRALKDRNDVPIAMMDSPLEPSSYRPFYQQILLALGKPYGMDDNKSKLLGRIITVSQVVRMKLLFIDEAEHLKTLFHRRLVLELSNRTQGICIAVASCKPDNFIKSDIELEGRFKPLVELDDYKGENLRNLLSHLELLLPFTETSNLPAFTTKDKDGKNVDGPAAFIQKMTDGVLRDIMWLIFDASKKAINENLSYIPLDLLKNSWKNAPKH